MKNMLKRSLALVLSIVLVAGLLCTGVSAADDRSVRVELDGKAVAFTDAEPTIIGGRTYMPFRAVFEALGAEVDYDGATRTVSAVRNGTTILIPIGSNEIGVTKGAISYSVEMDAAAFISDAGRTYIPVRFAAEALGCCVGWDADDRTVIIVDTESMVNKAVGDGQFTLVGKYMDYSEKLNKGNYEVKMNMDLACTMLAAKVLTASYDISGIVAGNTAGEMSMTIKMDLGGLVDLMAKLGGEDKDEILAALAGEGITDTKMEVSAQARVDMDKGAIYMSMSGIPGMEELLPEGTWLYIDMNELLEELGGYGADMLSMDYSGFKVEDFATPLINGMSYIDDKDSAYNGIKAQVDAIVGAFADSAFVKDGQSCTNTQKIDELGLTVTLRLDTDAAGELTGYQLDADMALPLETLDLDESVAAGLDDLSKLLGDSVNVGELKLSMSTGMDANNKQTVNLELSAGNLLLVTAKAEGSYTPTAKTPETGLPAGAKSISLEQWMASM